MEDNLSRDSSLTYGVERSTVDARNDTLSAGTPAPSWKHLAALFAVMILAAAVRIPHLGLHGYVIDEMWTAELCTGRGSLHQQMVVNQITPAPEFFRLGDAPPWWKIWTHMENTHPPLHAILLRWWEDLFGDSDASGRSLSVVFSLIALLIFFDVLRLLNGPSVAVWGAVLMALAAPQVEHARLTRNYTVLLAAALAMADALVRIEKLGLTRRRWMGLCAATLASLLTHYFSIGTILSLFAYSAIRFSGPTRRRILAGFLLGGGIFAVIWGPFMWQQRQYFSTTDEGVSFLVPDSPNHLLVTLERTLVIPGSLLFPTRDSSRGFAMGGAVLYVLPFVMFRRRPDLLLWGCWLVGTVAVPAGLDFIRHTTHLNYARYTLLAGPAVYAMLPMIFMRFKLTPWLVHAIPAAAALGCAVALPDVYTTSVADPAEMIRDFKGPLRPTDLLIFGGKPVDRFSLEFQYMFIDRYMGPVPCPVIILMTTGRDDVAKRVLQSTHAYLFSPDLKCRLIVPDSHPTDDRMYYDRALRWRLK